MIDTSDSESENTRNQELHYFMEWQLIELIKIEMFSSESVLLLNWIQLLLMKMINVI
jgi:hypothetical protein